MFSKSIFTQDYQPRTTRKVFDSAVYSSLAVGHVHGAARSIPALVSAHAGNDAPWHVVNLKHADGQFDAVAVLGAPDEHHAAEWAMAQHGRFFDSTVCNVVESNHFAIKRHLNDPDLHTYVSHLRPETLAKLQDVTTGKPVLWDGMNLLSHGQNTAQLMVDLIKHDDHGVMQLAMTKDDMAAMIAQGEVLSFDSIVVQKDRLDKTMDKLKAAMIHATASGVGVDEVTISDPFKKNKVTQIAALFALNDGQSVTILFHSPDTTPDKIAPKDKLISWKWLLNSRDVSAAVQPDQGKDVDLKQVAIRLMKLVNANSEKFKKANAKKEQNTAEMSKLKEVLVQKAAMIAAADATIADLQSQIDARAQGVAVEPQPTNTQQEKILTKGEIKTLEEGGAIKEWREKSGKYRYYFEVSGADARAAGIHMGDKTYVDESGRFHLDNTKALTAYRDLRREDVIAMSADEFKAYATNFIFGVLSENAAYNLKPPVRELSGNMINLIATGEMYLSTDGTQVKTADSTISAGDYTITGGSIDVAKRQVILQSVRRKDGTEMKAGDADTALAKTAFLDWTKSLIDLVPPVAPVKPVDDTEPQPTEPVAAPAQTASDTQPTEDADLVYWKDSKGFVEFLPVTKSGESAWNQIASQWKDAWQKAFPDMDVRADAVAPEKDLAKVLKSLRGAGYTVRARREGETFVPDEISNMSDDELLSELDLPQPTENPDMTYLQSIIDGGVDLSTGEVVEDALNDIAARLTPEIEPLFEQAVDVYAAYQAKQAAGV